jgi:hypothetical protein
MRMYFALFAASIASIVTVAACGARTGLPVAESRDEPEDAGPDVEDAPEAAPKPVVPDCEEAGISYIYLMSSENELLRFYPPDLSVTTIGTIACPTTLPGHPFSMAVDRHGIAFVLFDSGELFRVSTLTAACTATSFVTNTDVFPQKFGMGFSANKDDPGETLFIAGATLDDPGTVSRLGLLHTENFTIAVGASFSQDIGSPELTGTGDSRLFGFGPGTPDSHLAEIDKGSSAILSDEILDLQQDHFSAWAFAFWGGDFYFFTSEETGSSRVHKYTPGGTTTPPLVTEINGLTIVGAGVSTCAPSE